jgi:hypothetical protein
MKYFISYGFDDAKTFWGRKYYFVSCYVSEHQQVIEYPKYFWSKFQAKKFMKRIQKGVN